MELFLPGIISLVLAAFFAFLVLPRLGTGVLVGISIVALLLAGWHHYFMFSSEYRLSTWQDAYIGYAPWVVILVALLFIVNFAFTAFSQNLAPQPESIMDTLTKSLTNSTTNMPSAATATNSLTAGINRALTSKSPIIPNLGFSGSEV